MTDKIRDAAVACEAVKVSMVQTKDGIKITLVIHPEDGKYANALFADPVGSRYQMALVRLGDDNQPVVPQEKTEGQRAVTSAALLAKNVQFQTWLLEIGKVEGVSEAHAADYICKYCGIDSRRLLATDEKALEKFREIQFAFSKAIT